ncbi:MAG: hypothetical protein A2015_17510 [Spirochaetes bacterium GWF1_31_7]|nr:MAG: hypothetical protein A2Y30_05500 [Spirochaetes bacterium GWE1_32_154]OHD46251.1 MAG: hypothetical protein A2Y29_08505 [Spirochaetes bacterium GWE2_31_10]OHD48621.1 MAG: hypothetical protein A2015_17510 [Spirochaetes bacterium GWF1_31_7]OHD74409.1 MAG: hypothetical protein A2355_03065 [Spirochaetes bacterium RIFOXYB1_FULL_32_8]HBD93067.1 hypothetical protein [Spirochaetia bacterium]
MKETIIDFFKYEKNKLIHYIRKNLNYLATVEPEDIIQDVMIRVLEKINDGVIIENVSGFIYKSVKNKMIDQYRTRKISVSLNKNDETDEKSLESMLSDARFDIFSEVQHEELRRILFATVDELPCEQKSIWVATELEGKSFAELSAAWGVSMNTLLSRKHRANKVLKTKLSGLMV